MKLPSKLAGLKEVTGLQFLLVGGGGFVVDMLLFLSFSHYLGWPVIVARLAAFGFAVIFTWLGNRTFTFSHRPKMKKGKQLSLCACIACLAATVNLSVFYFFNSLAIDFPYWPAACLAIGVLAGLVINWLGANKLAFR